MTRSVLAVALFFAGPVVLIVAAVSLRTTGVVRSHGEVMARVLRFEREARRAADDAGVEVPLVLAVASVESAGDPRARSGAGAVGLMQLMEPTALEVARDLGEPDPVLTHPATSLRLGARYLRRQMDRFGDSPCAKELALAAYNAGPGAVQGWIDEAPPPPECSELGGWIRYRETRQFVQRVLDWEVRYARHLAERRGPADVAPR